ncbi:AsmA family protein [Marinobacter sp.]|uniref:AsmA family protein n=1 Tax=Marinobacter sp. TaxID=50741 RepID=UPI00356AC4DA
MPKALAKTLKWGAAGLIVLLVIAILAVELIPWNFLKPPITDRVESATGRELEIRGDITLGLLPRPHMTFEDVVFANTDWAEDAAMAAIARLEVVPSLRSLVRGEPLIEHLAITEPELDLQGRDGAPGNWVLPAMTKDQHEESADKAAKAGTASDSGSPVEIREITVTDGLVRYQPADSRDVHRLALTSLTVTEDQLSAEGELTPASGEPSTSLPFSIESGLTTGYTDNEWTLNDLEASLADIQLDGSMGLDLGEGPPVLSADLHAPVLDVPDILARLPESGEQEDTRELAIPALPEMAGNLQLNVDRIILPDTTVDQAEARITMGGQTMTLEPLKFEVADGEVEVSGALTSTVETVSGEARAQLQALDLHDFGVGDQPGHRLTADLDLALAETARTPALEPRRLLNNINIRNGTANYRTTGQDETSDLDLSLAMDARQSGPVLSVEGEFQNEPLTLAIEGAPLAKLAEGLAEYPLQARARSGQLRAGADTRLGALLNPGTLAADLTLSGDSARMLKRWIGPVVPRLPAFDLAGRLEREQQRWSVTGLGGTIGASNLTGDVHYQHGERPQVRVALDSDRLEIAQFMNDDGDGTPKDDASESTENNGDGSLTVLQDFDGGLELAVDTLVPPDGPSLDRFQTNMTLNAGKLNIEPLAFHVAGGALTASTDLNASDVPASGTVTVQLDDIALGQLGDTFSGLEDRLGLLSGELNLAITGSLPEGRRDDLLLPAVGRVDFEPSTLHFRDREAGSDITLELETHGREAAEQRFHIDGEGQYDDQPFSLRFRGDPLLDARDPDRPYGLRLSTDVVATRIVVEGSMLQPLALRGLDLGLSVEGPDPQRLSRLLGIPMPQLPPYSLSGDLSLEEQQWVVSNITGQAGESDLGGRIALDTRQRPPHIEADLSSESLVLRDLGGLVGTEPEASTEDESQAKADGDEKVLPDEPLVTPNWDNVSADVRYRAASVTAADIPLSDVEIDFRLEDGHARFEPVRFGVGDGQVDFNLNLDSTTTPPEGTLQLEARQVDLQQALRNWDLADDSVGTVATQGKFWVTGATMAELLASADGGLVVLMVEGKLDAMLVELAGLDASQSFLSWINARDPIPIRCAYGDLQVRDGEGSIDTLAVDTDDTTFTGTGTVDINTEQLDVTILAHPKDVSVFSARTPLHLGGTFSNMEVGLHEGELAMRAGGSAVLAALATPVAALLPLLDLGTGDDVPYCDGLVRRSRKAIDGSNDNGDHNDES